MKKVSVTLFIVLICQNVFSATYKYACGEADTVSSTLEIKPKKPGKDGYTLQARYVIIEKDPVTLVVTQKVNFMVGQTDLSEELTGSETPVITLFNRKNLHDDQLIIERTEEINHTVKARQVNPFKGTWVDFDCHLTSFSPK